MSFRKEEANFMNVVTNRPKFLTKAIAREAVVRVLGSLTAFPEIDPMRLHVVIMVPQMLVPSGVRWRGDQPAPYSIHPYVLYEHSEGKGGWDVHLDEIAKEKALALWIGFADGSLSPVPHLLMEGATKWVGGVKRDWLVVACSGSKSHADRLISETIASVLIFLTQHDWEESEEKKNREIDFIGEKLS